MIKSLKLKAESVDDFNVFSAVLQDAILKVGELKYSSKARTLTARLWRFRHEAQNGERILCGLRIDGVMSVQSQNLERTHKDAMAVLLSVSATLKDDQLSAILVFNFSGNGKLRIEVENIDALLADVEPAQTTTKIPQHDT